MCDFRQLYCGADGYIVRCNDCGFYQLGYSSMMLTLSENDFENIYQAAVAATYRFCDCEDEFIKQVVLPTPYFGVNILLSIQELKSFIHMLDAANSEVLSLEMINLFDKDKNY